MTDLLSVGRPVGGFGAVLADPPWAFETYGKKHTTPHRTANDHYETLTADRLRALPVVDLVARDSALFMWVVDSHLPEAIALGEAWGFKYKTIAFVWTKGGRIGMGYWTRKQAEICLLFTKGKPRVQSHAVRQLIDEPRREHSRKPDETHRRIEALVKGPYLELFARERRPGWQVWGDQTERFPDLQAAK